MTSILNKNEKTTLVNRIYNGYYHTSLDMLAHHIKTCDYVQLGEHEYVELAKTNIDTTIWYPDHIDDPASKRPLEEVFYQYNLNKFMSFGVRNHENDKYRHYDAYLCRNHNDPVDLYSVVYAPTGMNLAGYDYKYEETRKLTNEELAQLGEAEDTLRDKFMKRLLSYWKRYAHKISTDSYWADR
ncbi:hypothetical protein [Bifidobacterium sp. SO1]|uniref:hypothetical protein n=1 Tax=Bifidobacterium sp. SO1 TaxID=2809029 RepID=UPI001BDD03C2|nr:hypothetical protein [Bifidobacterium sp. SO1]MBT1162200.1 hypothetical protein [Bifidobacterium sp. SO1]